MATRGGPVPGPRVNAPADPGRFGARGPAGGRAGSGPLRRQRLLALVLLAAFLPTLTFLGHWDDLFGAAATVPAPAAAIYDLSAERAEQAEHSQHCHTNLASCSAQPLPAGAGLLVTRETLLLPPPLQRTARPAAMTIALSGPSIRPLLPPPRIA